MENNSFKLKWPTIIGYSLGDVANNFAFAMGALFLLSYYTDVAGVGAAAAGALLLGVRFFDAFADLLAGRVVDSVNTRWGKFRPFLLFASIPLMVISVLVFYVPSSLSHTGKVIYATITYAGLGLFYSLVNIPYGSLATAMTQDPLSRARLGAGRSIAASLTFVVLAFVIGSQIGGSDVASVQATYLHYTTMLAIAGLVLYFLCFKSTKENVIRTVAQPALGVSLRTVKKNHALIMLCGGALFMLTATFAVTATGMFYVRYVVGDPSLFTVMVLVQMFIGSVLPAFFVPSLVRRFGKKNTFLIGASIGFIGYLLFFFLSGFNFFVAMAGLCVASIGMGFAMTIMWALEADTVEYGEYQTGIRIEGLTYSLFSLTRKCGQALGGSIPAFIMGAAGYIANAEQTEEVIFSIRASIALLPAGAIAVSFLIMLFYPLTDAKFAQIMKEITARRAAKAAEDPETQAAINAVTASQAPQASQA